MRHSGLNRWAVAAVAALLAGTAWSQADEARAKKIVSGVCFVCHGAEGESSSELFPRLAGQHWEYTLKQPIESLKSGTLTVSVKDKQGNVNRVVRRFNVSPRVAER